jgi:hypothetical protein
MNQIEAEALTPEWSEADLKLVEVIAERLGSTAEEVLLPLASESKLDPRARNPRDPKAWPLAVGLAQFTRAAAMAMGLVPSEKPGDAASRNASLAAWKQLAPTILSSSVAMQLYLFERYLLSTGFEARGGKWDSAARIYQAIAAPATLDPKISKPTSDTIIYPEGSAGYEGNKALDLDGDGKITFGDLEKAVGYMKKHPSVVAALYRLGGK